MINELKYKIKTDGMKQMITKSVLSLLGHTLIQSMLSWNGKWGNVILNICNMHPCTYLHALNVNKYVDSYFLKSIL